MKFIVLFLSIFCLTNICNAQEVRGLSFCDYTDKEIPVSQLKKLSSHTCFGLSYNNKNADIIEILSYTFVLVPKDGSNTYFETVKNSKLTETIVERLQIAKPDDVIVFSNIKCKKILGKSSIEIMLNGNDFVLIP